MNYRLLIIKSDNAKLDNEKLDDWTLLRLKSPKNGEFNMYLAVLSGSGYDLFELTSYQHDSGSLFVDEHVQADCTVYLACKYDLNYFLVAMSMRASEIETEPKSISELKTKLADECLETKTSHLVDILKKLNINRDGLSKIFEVKGEGDDEMSVVLSQTKLIEWLKSKCDRLSAHFEAAMAAKVGAKASNKQTEAQQKDKTRMEAFEVVSQYINKYLAGKLRKELGLAAHLNDKTNDKETKRIKF